MENDISPVILTTIITVLLNFIVWWFQRIVNGKTIRIERRKVETEIRNEELSAISTITERYNDLSSKYISASLDLTDLRIEFEKQNSEIKTLTGKIDYISKENSILAEKNRKIFNDVELLKLENEKLRSESDELRKGIGILILQLRQAGINPAWQPLI